MQNIKSKPSEQEPAPSQIVAANDNKPSNFLTIQQLLALPPPEWLISQGGGNEALGLIPEGVTTLFGPKGDGKTWVAIDWACQVAKSGGLVVYIFTEGSPSAFGQRVAAWQEAYGALPTGTFTTHVGAVNLAEPSTARGFIARVREHVATKARLVVVDTLARCFGGGDENKTSDMNQFIANIDLVRAELGASVLVLHHTGKDTSRGSRGSTALPGAADCEVFLHRSAGGQIIIENEKMRNAEEWGAFAYKLDKSEGNIPVLRFAGDVAVKADDDTEAVRDAGEAILVLLTEAPGQRSSEMLVELTAKGISSRTYYRARRKLVDGGAIIKDKNRYYLGAADLLPTATPRGVAVAGSKFRAVAPAAKAVPGSSLAVGSEAVQEWLIGQLVDGPKPKEALTSAAQKLFGCSVETVRLAARAFAMEEKVDGVKMWRLRRGGEGGATLTEGRRKR